MRVLYETKKYKHIALYESKMLRISFVKDKSDTMYDKIKIVRFGNEHMEPEIICIYRYEDEQLIEQMLDKYKQ